MDFRRPCCRNNAEQFERELPRIGIDCKLSRIDGHLHAAYDFVVHPLHMLNDRIAHRPRPVVELGIGGEHRASFQTAAFNPLQPVIKDNTQASQSARCFQRRNKGYLVVAAHSSGLAEAICQEILQVVFPVSK